MTFDVDAHLKPFIPGVFNLRPSGEFCAAREGYFTKYNEL